MIAPFAARCPSCGAEGARRAANPGIALGFGLMGVYLIQIAFTVSWYGGVGLMHQMLGWTLLGLTGLGVFKDARALAARGETSGFWIETRSRCGDCGQRGRYAPLHVATRVLLAITFGVFVYLRFGSMLG